MRSRKKKKHLCFIAGLMLLTVFIGVILYIGFNYILDKIQEPKYVVLEAEKNHNLSFPLRLLSSFQSLHLSVFLLAAYFLILDSSLAWITSKNAAMTIIAPVTIY